jgi:hypothetical protein
MIGIHVFSLNVRRSDLGDTLTIHRDNANDKHCFMALKPASGTMLSATGAAYRLVGLRAVTAVIPAALSS